MRLHSGPRERKYGDLLRIHVAQSTAGGYSMLVSRAKFPDPIKT